VNAASPKTVFQGERKRRFKVNAAHPSISRPHHDRYATALRALHLYVATTTPLTRSAPPHRLASLAPARSLRSRAHRTPRGSCNQRDCSLWQTPHQTPATAPEPPKRCACGCRDNLGGDRGPAELPGAGRAAHGGRTDAVPHRGRGAADPRKVEVRRLDGPGRAVWPKADSGRLRRDPHSVVNLRAPIKTAWNRCTRAGRGRGPFRA
jgi:hypothetical protein